MPERKTDSFSKFKKGEDFNHRDTLTYFNEQEKVVFFKINDLIVHILKILVTVHGTLKLEIWPSCFCTVDERIQLGN